MRPRIRPTFRLELTDKSCWLEALALQLEKDNAPVVGMCFRRHAVIQVPKPARHFWSPNLNIEIRTEEEGQIFLHGRFGPQPNIWTGFMALYGVLILVALIGAVLGFSQLGLGSMPWGLMLVPACLGMGAFVYGAGFIGQGLSAEQMYEMRSFVDDVLEDCISSEDSKGDVEPDTE